MSLILFNIFIFLFYTERLKWNPNKIRALSRLFQPTQNLRRVRWLSELQHRQFESVEDFVESKTHVNFYMFHRTLYNFGTTAGLLEC